MIEINLLPGQKRKTAGASKFKLPDFKALLTNIKDPWLISAVVTWVVVGGLLAALFFYDTAKKASLSTRVDNERHEADRYSGFVAQKRAEEKRRDSLVVQINVIRQIDQMRYVWPHILDQVTKALPPYTWLFEMQQTVPPPAPPAANGQRPVVDSAAAANLINVTINGRTVDIQAYTTFLRQLAASPWITDVTPASNQTIVEQDRPVTEFIVSFKYKQADSAFIRTVPLVQSVR